MASIKKKLKLRKVCMDDASILWNWSNDTQVRNVSFSSTLITWEEHIRWINSKLNNPKCVFYIAFDNDNPVGQIRYDLKADCAIVSISIDEKYRGKGYGSLLARSASNMIFETSNVKAICAYIKPTNIASIRAFSKANFKKTKVTNIDGTQAIEFKLMRNDTK
jgi:UDP-2,4-diacetamido-2,4,6-trideoxy-beta-L-altropyranose hydrolase